MTLHAQDVSVRFGGIQALDGVSVEVAPGEVAAVVGSNGSGKSTLFNAIMGFAPLERGAIALDGAPIHGLAPHRRVQRGLCRTFQTPHIDPESTVFDAVRSGGVVSLRTGLAAACLATPRGRAEAAAIDTRAGKVLEALNLSHLARAEMGELPMGTVRLVDVGRAVMGRPRFILLDEPAAGLSHVEQEALKAQIRRLAAEGVGVLLVEHNFRFVADLSDRMTVLERGRVLDRGRPDEVSRRPEFIRIYLGSLGETKPDAGAASPLPAAPAPAPSPAARPLMECRGVSARHGRIQVCFDVDLDVPAVDALQQAQMLQRLDQPIDRGAGQLELLRHLGRGDRLPPAAEHLQDPDPAQQAGNEIGGLVVGTLHALGAVDHDAGLHGHRGYSAAWGAASRAATCSRARFSITRRRRLSPTSCW